MRVHRSNEVCKCPLDDGVHAALRIDAQLFDSLRIRPIRLVQLNVVILATIADRMGAVRPGDVFKRLDRVLRPAIGKASHTSTAVEEAG